MAYASVDVKEAPEKGTGIIFIPASLLNAFPLQIMTKSPKSTKKRP